MSNRRGFIKSGIIGVAGINLLPAVNSFAKAIDHDQLLVAGGKFKLRFALVSDGHYGQPGTEYDAFYTRMVDWMNKEHQNSQLDFVIVNGDLVHNRPDLLGKVKETYLDKLPVPYYTIPGNHDFADGAIWKRVFGYDDKYTVDKGEIGFVFANTANTKGEYVCPDYDFLKRSLDAFKSKSMVFVILHIAPHQWLPEEKNIFLDCPQIVELLHAYPNVKAAFHGHDHSLDGVRYTGKLPHLFDSHFGGNWGTEYKGYRIVEVGNDNQIYTYQVNASQNPMLNSNKL
ncbi:metallophosphoesterase family protein [Mucilaginibacter paludis]|uniref:Metallophosphoesterase n=1 Tax=Mucilaginibacter paludis DSM 18603 TaxID=714943 RepID=H1Y7A5_9SPHI|nr:metallophosphoesterase [Mucilaginibacter paludis]EHQ28992.1 metallophosphoesterase [Mucilaginibacter paludis DSM 18603]